jgi:hypothetical protein
MNIKTPSKVPNTEWSEPFLQGMIDRMGISYHKYGAVADAVGKIDEIESLRIRLQKYVDSGNTEYLMDVANFAMIEFMHKGPKKFRPTDSDESPGRAWLSDGYDEEMEISARANDYSIQ